MDILLVSATLFEIRPLLDRMVLHETRNEHLSQYRFKRLSVDVLITGIGMVATAFHLGKQLRDSGYDLAINAGICGSFRKSIPIGEVLQVNRDYIPELGAEEGELFHSVTSLGLTDPDTPPFTNGRLHSKPGPAFSALLKLPEASGITVNTIHGNARSIEKIKLHCDPDIESMEGAAFFYACLLSGIPCIQVRAVSNYVEVRDKSKWNIPLAVGKLNEAVEGILKDVRT